MIEYAIATEEMDRIMSRLHRLFDIRITFFDMKEHELKQFHIKPMSAFCAAFRRKKERDACCSLCDASHLEKSKEIQDVHVYQCHSGLIEGIVPLYDRRGIYLGAIVFGQLRKVGQPPRDDWSPALKKLYEKLPSYTLEKALDIGHVLKCVCESIIDRELISYRSKPWVETLENYIEAHLHEKITSAQLSKASGKSSSFISRHFESEFGQTPRQYILKRRMEEAKTMLKNGMSVQCTAGKLGFYDAFHFSKTFKKFWGKTPNDYRTK